MSGWIRSSTAADQYPLVVPLYGHAVCVSDGTRWVKSTSVRSM